MATLSSKLSRKMRENLLQKKVNTTTTALPRRLCDWSPPSTTGPSDWSPPSTTGPSDWSPPSTTGPSDWSPPSTTGPSHQIPLADNTQSAESSLGAVAAGTGSHIAPDPASSAESELTRSSVSPTSLEGNVTTESGDQCLPLTTADGDTGSVVGSSDSGNGILPKLSEKDPLSRRTVMETNADGDSNCELTFSKEVSDLAAELACRAQTSKPPTVASLKVFTRDTLEALLRFNGRPLYRGLDKQDVARMVLEFMVRGCPPRCPKCQYGHLRFSNGRKRAGKRYYWCPGSTKDGKHFFGCNFKADASAIQRTPWKSP